MKVTQAQYDAQVRLIQELEESLADAQKRKVTSRQEGDLRENSEYESACRDIEMLTNHMAEAHDALDKMQIDKDATISASKIGILTNFTMIDLNTNKEQEYTLVDINGAPPKDISANSKFGKLVKGKHVGDIIEYTDNAFRTQKFQITAIL
jgi:transcription elongation GreA/GreB family factor